MTDTINDPDAGATEVVEESVEHDEHEHHGPTDAFFIKTAAVLAVITALEVAASYVELGALFLPILLGLMLIKFFAVVLIFMHVKYDAAIFGRLFWVGLVLAVVVYGVMLLTFQFFLK